MKNSFFATLTVAAALAAVATPSFAQVKLITFNLEPNPKFLNCIKASSNGPAPKAEVTVLRGKLNDTLVLRLKDFKPNLAFDLFTVQNSNLRSDGTVDLAFLNFGMAWYQSDVQVENDGEGEVSIKTILLDQIFGFDPIAALPPTNTFHVGFWFNDPKDAAACGFDITKPTPFNGEHSAGPLAMISVPNPDTGIGPLCTNPGPGGTCHP